MNKNLSLSDIHNIHFTGIKGVGMTALACYAQDLGIKISGSDVSQTFITDETLRKRKIKWHIGFRPENILSPDLLIATGAHGGLANPEVLEAKKRNIPVMTYGEALGLLMKRKTGISVCGVGGKTTTSAMLATILHYNEVHPSYVVGVAEIFPLGAPGHYDKKGQLFVAEADEYATSPGVDNRPKFLWQEPKYIIATNIEYDHPDVYKNIGQTRKAFLNFFQKIPSRGLLVINGDNDNNLETVKTFKKRFVTYGIGRDNDWQIRNIYLQTQSQTFDLYYHGRKKGHFAIKIPGQFNIMNAAAAIILSLELGLRPERVKRGLEKFRGTKRRFELIGQKKGIRVYDDYAHHPREIQSTLRAAKDWFGKDKRIIVIFQPHTYSRTQKLLTQFAQSFSDAYRVIIVPIYAAREKKNPLIDSKKLVSETSRYHPRVNFVDKKEKVVAMTKNIAQKNDIIFTMGAGNVWKIGKKILEIL